jgi:hypothetical protein
LIHYMLMTNLNDEALDLREKLSLYSDPFSM